MGRNSFSARCARRLTATRRKLSVESLEPRILLAGDTYLINFQPAASTSVGRYHVDSGATFGPRGDGLSYGWSTNHTNVAQERDASPDQRLDTLIQFHQNQQWEFALPNGKYAVTVSVGDPAFGSQYTINVEGVNYWTATPLSAGNSLAATHDVTVSDGRLSINQGAAGESATRINYVHIVGLPATPNASPSVPTITEPHTTGQIVHPADVHMEAIGFFDADGHAHESTDWEIWSVGPGAEPVWQTLGIEGVERNHTHMGDGIFINSHAGRTDLISDPLHNFEFNTYTIILPGVTAGDELTITAEMIDARGGGGAGISGMVDSFSLLTPLNQEILQDGSFEQAVPGTQFSNSEWMLNAEFDGIEPAAQFQAADWAAESGNIGVWFKGFRGTGANPVDAQVVQVVTAPISGDYKLTFTAKVEQNFPSVIGGFQVTLSSDGTGGAQTVDLLDSSPREYELRVRYRDETGAVSGYATRRFTVAPASTIFPMELQDIADFPAPTWIRTSGPPVSLPPSNPNLSQLRVESAGGELLWSLTGSTFVNPPALSHHVSLRLVVVAGSSGLVVETSKLSFRDETGLQRTIALPALNLAANERLDLWVSIDGSTYFGSAAQTEPDFSHLAFSSDLAFVALQPGYEIDVVATDLRLPVNIAFVPNPGPNPDDPLYYIAELYGSIQVVRRDGTRQTFATSLLDYNPEGPFGGSGEQGLSGLAVQRDAVNPSIYHLYVGMLWDNNAPPGPGFHYPKVERLTSAAGGLTMASRTLLLNMQPETQGQSHQISNISIGPDNKLYVHMGDGFNFTTAQNLNQFRGKVLRMNLDGTASSDNPFYNAGNGISATDYVFAYGFRNPFGGAWRAADGKHYEVENGPSVDRLAQVNRGVNYGWNDTDASMAINAIYNWPTAHAPVNLAFIQQADFQGSQIPAGKMDHLFVSESGATYASGPQTNGKRISEFVLNASGNLVSGPTTLVQYSGTGRGSVVALAAGPDGLYFSELYENSGANGPTAVGARIFRVRYVNPLAGDYNIDGTVDQADYAVWKMNFGSNLYLAADGNQNGIVDTADYTVWRDNVGAHIRGGAAAIAVDASAERVTLEPAAADSGVAEVQEARRSLSWVPLAERKESSRPIHGSAASRSHASTASRDAALLSVLDALELWASRERSSIRGLADGEAGNRTSEAGSNRPTTKPTLDVLFGVWRLSL